MTALGPRLRRFFAAPLRALLPRHPAVRWFLLALPFLILAFFLEPVVRLLVHVTELVLRVVEPLLQTTIGRLLLIFVLFAVSVSAALLLLRGRFRAFRGRTVLGRHLQAVSLLLGGENQRSRDVFARIGRRRNVRPDEYPAVAADANLKLARMALALGDANAALRHLTRIVEHDLPIELRRSLAQLRIAAMRRQPNTLPETLEHEVRTALGRHRDDVVLLAELRTCLLQRGDRFGAAEQQVLVHKHAAPTRKEAERVRLADDLCAAAAAALQQGDAAGARAAHKRLAKVDAVAAGMVLGDVLRHEGDLRGAVRAFGATRSPRGLDRIAELLAAHPGAVAPEELLAACPLQGTLLLVARELARLGRRDEARRAAQRAAELLGPTETVCAVLAEVLALLGQPDEARAFAERTVERLLLPGTPPRAS